MGMGVSACELSLYGVGILMLHLLVISPALYHKSLYDAVENKSVKKPFFCKLYEISNRFGRFFGIKLCLDRSVIFNFTV